LIQDLTEAVIADLLGKFDECVKIWLCFPPTDLNLDIYKRSSGFINRLIKCLRAGLEGGYLIRQSSGSALVLPHGTLHAVVTLKGGVVVNSTFSMIEGLPTQAKLIGEWMSTIL
jgi:hypothetical protein